MWGKFACHNATEYSLITLINGLLSFTKDKRNSMTKITIDFGSNSVMTAALKAIKSSKQERIR